MADAMKNGGIVLGPIVTIIIAIFCIWCMHMLVTGAEYLMQIKRLSSRPDFAETIELSFACSKKERWRKCSKIMKNICNVFICVTQLGFCCVYILFVARSVKIVLDYYGFVIEFELMATIVLFPIWLTALVRQLKNIGEV